MKNARTFAMLCLRSDLWTFRLQRHTRVLKADANRRIVASAQKLTDLQSETEQQNHTHDEQLSHSTVSMNTGKCDAFISLGACVFLACIPNTSVYDTHTHWYILVLRVFSGRGAWPCTSRSTSPCTVILVEQRKRWSARCIPRACDALAPLALSPVMPLTHA